MLSVCVAVDMRKSDGDVLATSNNDRGVTVILDIGLVTFVFVENKSVISC